MYEFNESLFWLLLENLIHPSLRESLIKSTRDVNTLIFAYVKVHRAGEVARYRRRTMTYCTRKLQRRCYIISCFERVINNDLLFSHTFSFYFHCRLCAAIFVIAAHIMFSLFFAVQEKCGGRACPLNLTCLEKCSIYVRLLDSLLAQIKLHERFAKSLSRRDAHKSAWSAIEFGCGWLLKSCAPIKKKNASYILHGAFHFYCRLFVIDSHIRKYLGAWNQCTKTGTRSKSALGYACIYVNTWCY